MDAFSLHQILVYIQKGTSIAGILIILTGVLFAVYQYVIYLCKGQLITQGKQINKIRGNLGRVLILGLEFIVAADLIGTTTTPDYYTVGIVASIVAIRTLLSFTINRELMMLNKEG